MVVNGAVHALGSDKAAIENAIAADPRAELSRCCCRSRIELAGDKITVDVAASKDEKGQAEVWLCPITQVRAGCDRPRRKQRTHDHLSQRGAALDQARRLDRQGRDVQCAGQGRLQTDNIDSAAVVVQTGVASAPKLMLGAAQIAVQ